MLSPATRTKLATLEKGQLMVRHPHFTQPIFVRFPRPAVMRGRDGVERFPQADEPPLDVAVTRALRGSTRRSPLEWVKDVVGAVRGDDVLRARNATLRTRPDDVKAYFRAQFRRIVPPEMPRPPRRAGCASRAGAIPTATTSRRRNRRSDGSPRPRESEVVYTMDNHPGGG